MRVVGRRRERPLAFHASAELLAQGGRFNDEIHRLPVGGSTFIPKGIHRYATLEQANRHWERCTALGMARIAAERALWKSSVARPRSKT